MSVSAPLVRERGIPFSGPLIAPTMDGCKTETRRLKGLNRINESPDEWKLTGMTGDRGAALFQRVDNLSPEYVCCPYGRPGDRLWVRETWALCEKNGGHVIYRAEGDGFSTCHPVHPRTGERDWRWHPSIHMPRKYSRITLEITDVRVERVQEISEEDALAEGIVREVRESGLGHGGLPGYRWGENEYAGTARHAFELLWDSINAKRGYGWDLNPWVWALSFRVVTS